MLLLEAQKYLDVVRTLSRALRIVWERRRCCWAPYQQVKRLAEEDKNTGKVGTENDCDETENFDGMCGVP
jgi:hypothetical protein